MHPTPPPTGGQANIDPAASFPVFLHFLFFFSFSTRPRQMGINRKSRKQTENKLVVKCSGLNFYFKGILWNGEEDWRTRPEDFEASALWTQGVKLRWRDSGENAGRWMEDTSGTFELCASNATRRRLIAVRHGGFITLWTEVRQTRLEWK